MILDNLVGNAVRYAVESSLIVVALDVTSADKFQLRFTNATLELEPEDLPHLRERLWRKDKARIADGCAGLGLALVAAYAACLKLRIATELDTAQYLSLIHI